MTYKSTRGAVSGISFSEAVLRGIAPDGGLFVPEQNVRFDSLELAEMCEMDYKNLAARIIARYATDFTDAEISCCVEKAYGTGSRFDGVDPAPVVHLNGTLSMLELWHGPTAAFKDMALQILPAFMSTALKKRREKERIAILTATSGDTGKAALEGFRDADGIDIIVFYPEHGVSRTQKQQMVTQEGGNVSVAAVRGNFDDAQTGVKRIFADAEFAAALEKSGWRLSSANSINFGRLLPQIIYYFHAYFSLVRADRISMGAKVNFVVPTGNFGDILAAYYAFKSGLPVGRLICAANSNNVVSDFIRTGFYDANREFTVTVSPAMDILISSNLERLIYDMSGEDEKATARRMMELSKQGCYNVDRGTLAAITSVFWSDFATEEETKETIAEIYREYGYLADPHTAVGINVYDKYVISTGDITPTVAVSTASPFKFTGCVAEALAASGIPEFRQTTGIDDEFRLPRLLSSLTGKSVPEPLADLDRRPVLHTGVCGADRMKDWVTEYIENRKDNDHV